MMEIKEMSLLLFGNDSFLQETVLPAMVPSHQGQIIVPHTHKFWALYSPVCSWSVKITRTPVSQAVMSGLS